MSTKLALAGLDPRRVALVHDWLITDRGGERVLDTLCRMFPEATLFTLFHVPGTQSTAIEHMPIRTTFIARLPFVSRLYRHYLPLFPRAIESLDLRDYDLVLSSSHCVAKAVKPREGAGHLCYCHTPMRYAYDQFDDYFPPDRLGGLVRLAAWVMMKPIRRCPRPVRYSIAAIAPTRFLAITEGTLVPSPCGSITTMRDASGKAGADGVTTMLPSVRPPLSSATCSCSQEARMLSGLVPLV